MTAKQVYEFVREECSMFDAIYEDYIVDLVGFKGLDLLKENKMIETCGVINGRQLYVLCG